MEGRGAIVGCVGGGVLVVLEDHVEVRRKQGRWGWEGISQYVD